MTLRTFTGTIVAALIQNLRTTSVTQTTVALAWDAYPGATAYQVRRDGALLTPQPTSPAFNDTGRTASTQYLYAVRPVVGGVGVASAEATLSVITQVAPPAGLTLSVGFDSAPSGTTYAGSIGSATVEARNGGPSPLWEHRAGEGWNGGGAVRLYGCSVTTGAYRGLNVSPAGGASSQVNIRYLSKWNQTWSGLASGSDPGGGASNLKGNYITCGGSPFWTQEKGMNFSLPEPYFQMAQSYQGTLYRAHGGSISCGAQSTYEIAGCDSSSSKWGTRAFQFGEFVNQWVCFELEITTTGRWKIYIWTANRAFNGQYMEARNSPTGPIGITGIGGMYYHDGGARSGSYLMLDELAMSNSYIGPPAGF